jgi:hypothetical protein
MAEKQFNAGDLASVAGNLAYLYKKLIIGGLSR